MPDLIVVLSSAFDFVSDMVDIAPPVLVEALVADLNLAVEAFDIGVLVGFTRLHKLMVDFPFVSPGIECGSRELEPVVCE